MYCRVPGIASYISEYILRNASLRSRKRYFLYRTGFLRFKFLHLILTTVECSIGYSIYFSLATIKRVFSFQIDWLRPKWPRFDGHDIEANASGTNSHVLSLD